MGIMVIYIMSYLFRISLVVGAVYMAMNDIKGWGWLIVVALITGLDTDDE